MTQDRSTPILDDLPHPEPDGQEAVRIGAGFLAARQDQLQARLDELDRELAHLEDAPTGDPTLEGRATGALLTLLDLLRPQLPQASTPLPTPLPETNPPAPGSRPRKTGPVLALVACLVALVAAVFLFQQYAWPAIAGPRPPVATAALAAPTPVSTPVAAATKALAAQPSPTSPRPAIPAMPERIGTAVQARMLQIAETAGTAHLQIPLTVMTATIQIDAGAPALEPVLPASGGGLHPGSAPFGQTGTTLVALSGEAAPASFRHIRPGDHMTGCNNDATCYDYQVTSAGTWELERLRQVLDRRPAGLGLLIYTLLDGTHAWVIQAQARGEATK